MGIEEGLKKRLRRTKLQNAVLTSLEIGGVIALAVVAPNVLKLLGKRYSNRSKESVENASRRLVEKGLVEWNMRDGKRFMTLTNSGKKALNSRRTRIARPKTWDGKWRIVIFDIAENRRRYRTLLRETLDEIGFKRLQDSVWIYPYDCEDLIVLLKTDFGLGKEVIYVIADSIENDAKVRALFKL